LARTQLEPGAQAPKGSIPLCVPKIMGKEQEYLKECLESNWVSSSGPFVDRFEQEIARRVETKHAVSTVTGTAALHIALLVAGVSQNDEVLVPSLTFIAPANAVRYVGAWPVFIDVEPEYWQMDPEEVKCFLETKCRWDHGRLINKMTGHQVKAILPVHILGHPVDMGPITEAARAYNLVVIEDATESLGATYKGRPVGHLGDIACFSFNGNKIITTGGGGMIVTDRDDWASKARYLTTQAKDDPLEYVHKEIGFNYRLSNVQAALGCAQLETLDERIAAKRRIAAIYSAAWEDVDGISGMLEAPWARSIFWLYTVLVDPLRFRTDSRGLLRLLEDHCIQSRPLWQPLHLSPAHRESRVIRCIVAERLNQQALSLPSSVGLSPGEQETVVAVTKGGET